MNFIKSLARKIIFPAVTTLGIEKLFSFSKNNCIVLMYHGVVSKTDFSISSNHLSAADFRKHLSYLKKNFTIVSLKEIFELRRNNIKPKRKTIAITFDDGYENNYSNAFPLLREFNLPATIFVTAECLVNPLHLLWYDKIDIMKNKINFSVFAKTDFHTNDKNKERLKKINSTEQLRSYLKSVSDAEKKIVFEKIISRESLDQTLQQTGKEFWKMLSREQMKEMSDSGLIEIGSHSVTHPNLDVLNEDELKIELMQSKKLLEDTIGGEVSSIAFPDGAYNEKVKQLSLQTGYKNLLAVNYRLPEDATDANILPRFCISNTTTTDSNMIHVQMSFGKSGF